MQRNNKYWGFITKYRKINHHILNATRFIFNFENHTFVIWFCLKWMLNFAFCSSKYGFDDETDF